MQGFSYSARMYMIYTLFNFMSHLILVFWRPVRFDYKGKAYLAICLLTAFAHQHFVVFVPGLLLGGLLLYCEKGAKLKRETLLSPIICSPLLGGLLAAFLHFGESYFPGAFQNFAANAPRAKFGFDLAYPLEILGSYSLVAPLYFMLVLAVPKLVLSKKWIPGPRFSTVSVCFLAALASVAVTLPLQVSYYVTPLQPLFFWDW